MMSKISPSKAILVTGAHRSGTTWVGKMLSANRETAYISEPLNVLHRTGVLGVPVNHWYTYITAENEAYYLSAFQRTLSLHYNLWQEIVSLKTWHDFQRMGRDWSIFSVGRIRGARPLLKDPFAIFSAKWFMERLNCAVVVTVRHPAAFASSLKRLNWHFNFRDLLDQPLLMRDYLHPFQEEMEAMLRTPEDIVGQSALLWCILYGFVAQIQTTKPDYFFLVRHEDLSLDPINGFNDLYHHLALNFTPRTQGAILNSSSSENPAELSKKAVHSVHLDSRANLANWKKRLSPQEISRIRELSGEVALKYYPDFDWE